MPGIPVKSSVSENIAKISVVAFHYSPRASTHQLGGLRYCQDLFWRLPNALGSSYRHLIRSVRSNGLEPEC